MSFSTAFGSTRSSTNSRTVSWISRCSSVSSKSTSGVYARPLSGPANASTGDEREVRIVVLELLRAELVGRQPQQKRRRREQVAVAGDMDVASRALAADEMLEAGWRKAPTIDC